MLRRPSPLTPPTEAASIRLVEAVAGKTASRMARLRRLTGVLAEVEVKLAGLAPAARRDLLHGPDLRGWLSEAELWLGVEAAAHRRDRRRLFDLVSRSEHLTALLPSGRLDARFPARALALARRRLRAARGELAAILCGLHLAFPGEPGSAARFEAILEASPDPEQGRPAHRIDLGSVAGPAGPLGIAMHPRVRVRWDGAALRLASGRKTAVVPRAALFVRGGLDACGWLVRRRRIPGTPILLAPEVVSSPRVLEVRKDRPGLGTRLAAAMRLVAIAWPQAHREIIRRTTLVVPVRERGLVSYSLAARPGVSFINVEGKPPLTLADDLLHETAHHLLHDAQEIEPDLTPGPDTEEVQGFDSPWRRARRPLHGLLHGAFTFHFRAELFTRLLRERRLRPRLLAPLLRDADVRFLRRERRRELSMIARSLRDLGTAQRHGLLTPEGRRLLAGMRAWHRRLLAGMAGGSR
jgi:HEXXH motif-containing protein